MSKFPQRDVDDLLVKCHRRCCICHRFCGVKIETDHIQLESESGPSTIDNAIAVCFECHAEIHSYNDRHPRGRKYHPSELKRHKEEWLTLCEQHPEMLLQATRRGDVGPLQALVDELEFNLSVSEQSGTHEQGALFLDDQFRRTISEGGIAIIKDNLRKAVLEAYVACRKANQDLVAVVQQIPKGNGWAVAKGVASNAIIAAKPKIREALGLLLAFLGSEK